jgi:prepilin-type N-terminal cleavage/methylation domain-containing protein
MGATVVRPLVVSRLRGYSISGVPRSSAFTLVELLIVVAIVAILAAIAVPNFLDAQTRAKVARVRSELRFLANGLEAYRVDSRTYPPGPIPYYHPGRTVETWRVTTPLAYIATVPRDVFAPRPGDATLGGPFGLGGIYLHYVNDPALDEYWLVFSYGPDGNMEPDALRYDPSNGTVSDGDLYLSAPRNR